MHRKNIKPDYITGHQKKLDAYKLPVRFNSEIDKKVKTLAAVIYHMVIKREATYYYKNNGPMNGQQCEGHRTRSSDDVYRVAKNYVPGITLKQVRESMAALMGAGKLVSWFCNDVQKTVYAPSNVTASSLETIKKTVKI